MGCVAKRSNHAISHRSSGSAKRSHSIRFAATWLLRCAAQPTAPPLDLPPDTLNPPPPRCHAPTRSGGACLPRHGKHGQHPHVPLSSFPASSRPPLRRFPKQATSPPPAPHHRQGAEGQQGQRGGFGSVDIHHGVRGRVVLSVASGEQNHTVDRRSAQIAACNGQGRGPMLLPPSAVPCSYAQRRGMPPPRRSPQQPLSPPPAPHHRQGAEGQQGQRGGLGC